MNHIKNIIENSGRKLWDGYNYDCKDSDALNLLINNSLLHLFLEEKGFICGITNKRPRGLNVAIRIGGKRFFFLLKESDIVPSVLLGCVRNILKKDDIKLNIKEINEDYCNRCGGIGYLFQYHHIDGGICFKCNGSGTISK